MDKMNIHEELEKALKELSKGTIMKQFGLTAIGSIVPGNGDRAGILSALAILQNQIIIKQNAEVIELMKSRELREVEALNTKADMVEQLAEVATAVEQLTKDAANVKPVAPVKPVK